MLSAESTGRAFRNSYFFGFGQSGNARAVFGSVVVGAAAYGMNFRRAKRKRKFDSSKRANTRRRGKRSTDERVRLKRKRFFGRARAAASAGANGDSITWLPTAGRESIETHSTATGVVFRGPCSVTRPRYETVGSFDRRPPPTITTHSRPIGRGIPYSIRSGKRRAAPSLPVCPGNGTRSLPFSRFTVGHTF